MKSRAITIIVVILTCICSVSISYADTSLLQEIEAAFVQLHEEVGPAVVNIIVTGNTDEAVSGLPELFHMYGVPGGPDAPEFQLPRPQSTGSGFLYDTDGHIVTNNHVIEDADSISVRLNNGNEYDAKVVGRDPESDVAVIKIDCDEKLTPAKLGDSDTLKPGQYAIAAGSPRGFEGSLSYGHISALGREGLSGLTMQGLRYQHLIQTDAAINLGNSGGPLCNIDGEVIGISLAIIYGANNIGFAIPINTAKQVIPDLIAHGRVTRGFIGVSLDDLTNLEAEALGLPNRKGALIAGLSPGQPGDKAGLKPYDVILKVDSEPIDDFTDLQRTIGARKPGDTVELEVWRDEKSIKRSLELAEWEFEIAEVPTPAPRRPQPLFGMRIEEITEESAGMMGLEEGVKGVFLVEVQPDSPAEKADLSHGDIIIELDRNPVTDAADFRERIEDKSSPGEKVLIRFLRGSEVPQITVIEVPKAE